MELWIGITIAAAFFQNLRSAGQKFLKTHLSTTSATFVRFGFGLPFAYLYFTWITWETGMQLPDFQSGFFFWASIACIAQIGATFLLLQTFSFRNFTVGTAYSRTEPAQTAIFALILFGEQVSAGAVLAIGVSIIGVVLISVARTAITVQSLLSSVTSPAAIMGLTSGTLFGLSAVGYREATFNVESDLFLVRSAATLCFALTLQTVLMLGWMLLREPEQLRKIRQAWRPALFVGFVGATASFGWFTAFTLQQAALVKVVAQIEMLFTFASSVFFFKEKVNAPEFF